MKALKEMGLVLAAFAASSVDAAAYCSTPSAPSCVSSYGSFDGEDDFERCKREMESYLSEVDDYTRCQKRIVDQALSTISTAQAEIDEAKSANDRRVSEYGEAVEAFNRRARAY